MKAGKELQEERKEGIREGAMDREIDQQRDRQNMQDEHRGRMCDKSDKEQGSIR